MVSHARVVSFCCKDVCFESVSKCLIEIFFCLKFSYKPSVDKLTSDGQWFCHQNDFVSHSLCTVQIKGASSHQLYNYEEFSYVHIYMYVAVAIINVYVD